MFQVVERMNGYKQGVFARGVVDCVAQGRGTWMTRPFGNGCEDFGVLNPFVIVSAILLAGAIVGVYELGKADMLHDDEVRWTVLVVVYGVFIAVCAMSRGRVFVLFFALHLPILWMFWVDAYLRKKKVKQMRSVDPFWVAYAIQLPLLSVLVDLETQRRNMYTVVNGVVSCLTIAMASAVLDTVSYLYSACSMQVAGSLYSDPDKSALDMRGRMFAAMRLSAGPRTDMSRRAAYASVQTSSTHVIANVGMRGMKYVWGFCMFLLYLILGKILMRYFINVAQFQGGGGLGMLLNALLLAYSVVPLLEIPTSTHGMLVWDELVSVHAHIVSRDNGPIQKAVRTVFDWTLPDNKTRMVLASKATVRRTVVTAVYVVLASVYALEAGRLRGGDGVLS